MRLNLSVELTGLPKCLSGNLAATFLENSLKKAATELVSGNKRAKFYVDVTFVVDTRDAQSPNGLVEPPKKRGRKAKPAEFTAATTKTGVGTGFEFDASDDYGSTS